MATIPLKPHILFLLDHLYEDKGGVYLQVRSLITLIRRKLDAHHAHISCTSIYGKGSTQCPEQTDFISSHDIKMIHPKLWLGKDKITLEDLNLHFKQFFSRNEKLDNVTHLVLIYPLSHSSDAPRHFLAKETSTKVVLLTQSCNLTSEDFKPILDLNLLDRTQTVVCVGPKVFNSINLALKELTNKTICLYPVYPTFSEQPSPNKTKTLSILTLYHICKSEKLPDMNPDSPSFMNIAAKSIGRLSKSILLSQSNSQYRLAWCIHCPGMDDQRRDKFLDSLRASADSPSLDITIETDVCDNIMTLVGMHTICMQSGDFGQESYSGLETLLAGIPTLVVKNSDVAVLMEKVGGNIYNDYFILEEILDSDDAALKWEKVLLKHFKDCTSDHMYERASEIRKRYLGYPDVHASNKEALHAMTGSSIFGCTNLDILPENQMPNQDRTPADNRILNHGGTQPVIVYAHTVKVGTDACIVPAGQTNQGNQSSIRTGARDLPMISRDHRQIPRDHPSMTHDLNARARNHRDVSLDNNDTELKHMYQSPATSFQSGEASHIAADLIQPQRFDTADATFMVHPGKVVITRNEHIVEPLLRGKHQEHADQYTNMGHENKQSIHTTAYKDTASAPVPHCKPKVERTAAPVRVRIESRMRGACRLSSDSDDSSDSDWVTTMPQSAPAPQEVEGQGRSQSQANEDIQQRTQSDSLEGASTSGHSDAKTSKGSKRVYGIPACYDDCDITVIPPK